MANIRFNYLRRRCLLIFWQLFSGFAPFVVGYFLGTQVTFFGTAAFVISMSFHVCLFALLRRPSFYFLDSCVFCRFNGNRVTSASSTV